MNNEIEKVLKEFEENGWYYNQKTKYKFYFSRNNNQLRLFEHIKIEDYKKYYTDFEIDMKTHQLLTKLFKALGWCND